MAMQTQPSHLLVSYFHTFGVFLWNEGRPDLQTCFRLRVSNVAQHDLQRTQRFACPVDTDVTEQPVFDRIPFRRSSWIMTNRDLKSVMIRHGLQFEFPKSRPATIAASAIGQNQELAVVAKTATSRSLPPRCYGIDGELRRVGRQANINVSPILARQVKAIRCCPTRSVLEKIVTVHLFRFQTPSLSSVLEVADQFFFLGIYADYRPTGLQKPFLLSGDVAKLSIPIRMRRPGNSFAVGLEREFPFAKQTPHGYRINRVALRTQQAAQAFQTEAHPLLLRHGIAAGVFFDQGQQVFLNLGAFFSMGGRPAPGRRVRPKGTSCNAPFNSRRPRRIVRTFMPVIIDRRRSPPWPMRFDSNATYQRRCCSSNRLKSRFICRCISLWGCSPSCKQSGHRHDRIASCMFLPPAAISLLQLNRRKMASNCSAAPK
jgi:hypothetical protein